MKITQTLYVTNRDKWKKWLQKNHKSKKEIWLIYYKKHTGKPRIPYDDAVEEAICFGWIDGLVKKLDEERYIQRYTPRNPKSLWSESNIKRAKKMVQEGKMTEEGLKIYREAMKSKQVVPSTRNISLPLDLKKALMRNQIAWKNFDNFTPSNKLMYIFWVNSAKKTETRQRRITKTVELSEYNRKLTDR